MFIQNKLKKTEWKEKKKKKSVSCLQILSWQTKLSLLGVIAKNCGMQFMEVGTASINDLFVKKIIWDIFFFSLWFKVKIWRPLKKGTEITVSALHITKV